MKPLRLPAGRLLLQEHQDSASESGSAVMGPPFFWTFQSLAWRRARLPAGLVSLPGAPLSEAVNNTRGAQWRNQRQPSKKQRLSSWWWHVGFVFTQLQAVETTTRMRRLFLKPQHPKQHRAAASPGDSPSGVAPPQKKKAPVSSFRLEMPPFTKASAWLLQKNI